MEFDINKAARDQYEYVVSIRRQIHEHPEKGMAEYETAKLIRRELDNMGIPWVEATPTGTIGIIRGNGTSDKILALRADIDALEMEEKTGLPFASKIPGMMHGCGHDMHPAMLLGAAKVFLEMGTENIPGTIWLLFQPGEETTLGAKYVVESGALDGIDAIYGQHIWMTGETGVIMSRPGGMMAGAVFFTIRVTGKGGHGSDISACTDALLPLAQIAVALNTVVPQNITPTHAVTLCVGKLQSGSRANIVAGDGVIEGNIRFLSDEDGELLKTQIEKTAAGIASAYGVRAEVEFSVPIPALTNDENMYEIYRRAAAKAVGEENIRVLTPVMGSEDFSRYSKICPSLFAFIGGRNEEKGATSNVHTNNFNPDEDAMAVGTAMYVRFATEFFRS